MYPPFDVAVRITALPPTGFISRVIDYRSPFTAMHSAGVAVTAREIAALAGFPDERVMEMHVAGNLYVIGKLAAPRAILEKPGRLTCVQPAGLRRQRF